MEKKLFNNYFKKIDYIGIDSKTKKSLTSGILFPFVRYFFLITLNMLTSGMQ